LSLRRDAAQIVRQVGHRSQAERDKNLNTLTQQNPASVGREVPRGRLHRSVPDRLVGCGHLLALVESTRSRDMHTTTEQRAQ
jgi:hypothetical protein